MSSKIQSLYLRERAIALAKAGPDVQACLFVAGLAGHKPLKCFHWPERDGGGAWLVFPPFPSRMPV